jgi:hypothetical protein
MTTVDEMHQAVDLIAKGWPYALADCDVLSAAPNLRGRAYDGDGRQAQGDHADPTAEQALTAFERHQLAAGPAAGWLAELADVQWMFLDRCLTGPVGFAAAMHALLDRTPTGWAPGAVQRLFRLADDSYRWWLARPKAGSRLAGVTVGERGNDVEVCGLCTEPVAGGASDPIRRIDGQAFHKSPCWYQVTMDRAGRPARRAS